jgi:hypothetical protein
MNQHNHSDREFHPLLLLIQKILRILHPNIYHPEFDHYSPECYNELREMIAEIKSIPIITALLEHYAATILTDEMRDCSKQELIDYHIAFLDQACNIVFSFLHVQPTGDKNIQAIGLGESFVQVTNGFLLCAL